MTCATLCSWLLKTPARDIICSFPLLSYSQILAHSFFFFCQVYSCLSRPLLPGLILHEFFDELFSNTSDTNGLQMLSIIALNLKKLKKANKLLHNKMLKSSSRFQTRQSFLLLHFVCFLSCPSILSFSLYVCGIADGLSDWVFWTGRQYCCCYCEYFVE